MDNRGRIRPLAELQEWDKNPRNINTADFARLKQQIEMLGSYKPLLVMEDGTVLGGNMRIKALRELGKTEVWTSQIDFIENDQGLWVSYVNGEEQAKRFNTKEDGMLEYALSDNDRAGYYDSDLLANLIPNFGIDWGMFGVDTNPATNLGELIEKFKEAEEDEAPGVDEKEPPKSILGEIYQVGEHRVMCGDSCNPDHVKALMDLPADMIFTDPPYNVNYSGRGENTSNTIKNDNMSNEQFEKFLTEAFLRMKENSRDNTPAYICYASSTHREFENALNAAGYEVRNQIIWVKKVASMGWGDYRWKHEPILYVKPKDSGVEFFGDRSQYIEWSQEMTDEELLKLIKRMIVKDEGGSSTVWRLHRDSDYQHPTQKPLQLVVIALKNSSTPGDIIMDLFGGSGSTLIAAEQTGRKARLMELDPKYVDVIRKRYAKFLKKEEEWESMTPKVGYVETTQNSSEGDSVPVPDNTVQTNQE